MKKEIGKLVLVQERISEKKGFKIETSKRNQKKRQEYEKKQDQQSEN